MQTRPWSSDSAGDDHLLHFHLQLLPQPGDHPVGGIPLGSLVDSTIAVIFHNTFYADTYSAEPTLNASVSDQRWGWGTVLRELLQLRFAVTDRTGVFAVDELFIGYHRGR
jgi:hypothetical protein